MRTTPWEHGSDFHWFVGAGELLAEPIHSWPDPRFYGSGRDAMRAAISRGSATRGWKRLWAPDYFCGEVRAELARHIDVRSYPAHPWREAELPSDIGASDVVLSVPYFGMVPPLATDACDVLEDHTHDPWSDWAQRSQASMCVASLRKTLPTPEGGVLWSPLALALPDAPALTPLRADAVRLRQGAIALKSAYLGGAGIEKASFLDLFQEGEALIAQGPVSGMSPATHELVPLFPVDAWRARRREAHALLSAALSECTYLRPLTAQAAAAPFAYVALADTSARRATLRKQLIAANIYPPVLWPLDEAEGCTPEASDISRRILILHLDPRYDDASLARVAKAVCEAAK